MSQTRPPLAFALSTFRGCCFPRYFEAAAKQNCLSFQPVFLKKVQLGLACFTNYRREYLDKWLIIGSYVSSLDIMRQSGVESLSWPLSSSLGLMLLIRVIGSMLPIMLFSPIACYPQTFSALLSSVMTIHANM